MTPRAGDFAVVRTGGLAGRIIRWATGSVVNHAFVYVGDGLIVEAQPGGAALSHISAYPTAYWSALGLTDSQRASIVYWVYAQVGTGYGWPDIAALGLARLGFRSRWVDRRIERSDRLICSQLVDKAYDLAGVHLFDDGRLPGEVTPGDLLDVIIGRPAPADR